MQLHLLACLDVTAEMQLSTDEIFGPVVGIQSARDEQHALELANSTDFGLSSAVFSANIDRGLQFARQIKAGMAAKIAGCQHIIAVDVHENRLALAKELGATHTLNGKEVDVVEQSLNALRPLGTVAIVGITPEMSIDIHNDLMAEGKSMIGVIEGDSVPRVFIPQLIAYYKAGQFPFNKLVKFYDFAQINQAFSDSASGITIKPVLKIS
ncbi:MAG TPA: aldehyde dehydrogenase family protein [Thiopseudomonas sp.]|nr:aldehyde dehydrogenase family protein [Thiopseudomonas sp.]